MIFRCFGLMFPSFSHSFLYSFPYLPMARWADVKMMFPSFSHSFLYSFPYLPMARWADVKMMFPSFSHSFLYSFPYLPMARWDLPAMFDLLIPRGTWQHPRRPPVAPGCGLRQQRQQRRRRGHQRHLLRSRDLVGGFHNCWFLTRIWWDYWLLVDGFRHVWCSTRKIWDDAPNLTKILGFGLQKLQSQRRI